jgi:hypothetical protein
MTNMHMLCFGRSPKFILRVALLFGLSLTVAGSPLLAQQPDSPDQGSKTNSPSGHIPRQQAPPPDSAQQNTAQSGVAAQSDAVQGHRPPDNRWHAPIAAFAGLLGITALLAHFGLAGPVASAVGGILVIALLIVLLFLVWWRIIRKYGIAGRRNT